MQLTFETKITVGFRTNGKLVLQWYRWRLCQGRARECHQRCPALLRIVTSARNRHMTSENARLEQTPIASTSEGHGRHGRPPYRLDHKTRAAPRDSPCDALLPFIRCEACRSDDKKAAPVATMAAALWRQKAPDIRRATRPCQGFLSRRWPIGDDPCSTFTESTVLLCVLGLVRTSANPLSSTGVDDRSSIRVGQVGSCTSRGCQPTPPSACDHLGGGSLLTVGPTALRWCSHMISGLFLSASLFFFVSFFFAPC